MKIAYMVGSPSSTSLNRGLARASVSLAPEGVESVDPDAGSLPLYDRNYDGNWPEVATAFEKAVDEADGVVIITPEHNHIHFAAVANAAEWSSRPWGTASLGGRSAALAGVSPSPVAMGIAQTHLCDLLTLLGSKLYLHEVYISTQQAGITPEGSVAEGSRDFLIQFIGGFVDFVKASKRSSLGRSLCASVSQRDRSVRHKPSPSPEALHTATKRV